jgi:hypothetical protein
MKEMFTDSMNPMLLEAIQVDIEEQLFEDWSNNNLDEGEEYAEFKFMEFAPDNVRQSYNEFYGYKEGDEYFLC